MVRSLSKSGKLANTIQISREQARRFSLEGLAELHSMVVDSDRALKGGGSGDVLLPALVAAMAGVPEAALDLPVRVSR